MRAISGGSKVQIDKWALLYPRRSVVIHLEARFYHGEAQVVETHVVRIGYLLHARRLNSFASIH